MESFHDILVFIIPLILAITLHEATHGFVAFQLGDDTAKRLGRVTLDPIKHIDPAGTVILPLMLVLMHAGFIIGWAKPVPVNFRNLHHPGRDMFLVAFAGPATNLVLAFISALALHLEAIIPPENAPLMYGNFYMSVTINITLAVFNLIPLLPLDGGRMLNALLPPKLAKDHARTERHGMAIILLLFILPNLLFHISLASHMLYPIMDFLRDTTFHLAGIGNNE